MITDNNIRYKFIFNIIIVSILLLASLYFISNMINNFTENSQNVEVLNSPVRRDTRLHQIENDDVESEIKQILQSLNYQTNNILNVNVKTQFFNKTLFLKNHVDLESNFLNFSTQTCDFIDIIISPNLFNIEWGYSKCKNYGVYKDGRQSFNSSLLSMYTKGTDCFVNVTSPLFIRVRPCYNFIKELNFTLSTFYRSYQEHDGLVSCSLTYQTISCSSGPYLKLLDVDFKSDKFCTEYFCDNCDDNTTESMMFNLGYEFIISMETIKLNFTLKTTMKVLNVYSKTFIVIINDSLAGPLSLLSIIGLIKFISKKFKFDDTSVDMGVVDNLNLKEIDKSDKYTIDN